MSKVVDRVGERKAKLSIIERKRHIMVIVQYSSKTQEIEILLSLVGNRNWRVKIKLFIPIQLC